MMRDGKDSIKVVRIFSRLNIGGPALHVALLSSDLNNRYKTILMTGKVGVQEGDMSYILRPNDRYQHVFVPELGREVRPFKDLIAFLKIYSILRRIRPTIIHTHTSKAGVLGRLAAILARVPVRVHTFHGHVFEKYYGPFKTCLIRFLEKILGYFTTHVIAISKSQHQDLVERFKVVSWHKSSVIPLGFDLTPFKESGSGKDQLNLKYHIKPEMHCVGIIGRLVPIKNHRMFLGVAAKVLKKRKDVHFFIIGDGPCDAALRAMADRMHLSEHVSFLGWQKELKPFYEMLDIVCLTSLNEGTPVSLIEAQACGIPVIATRAGGTEDVVFHGKNGYLIDAEDEVEFSEKIIFLLDHPAVRRQMAIYGRAFVFDHFDKGKLLFNIDQLYLKLLGEKEI